MDAHAYHADDRAHLAGPHAPRCRRPVRGLSPSKGIPPLERTALGTQLFREDREEETWFVAVSYWPSMEAMTAFTKGEPTKVHHLDRDPDFLIELPDRVEIYRILVDRQGLR